MFVSLKKNLQQCISEPEFYGDLIYRIRKKIGENHCFFFFCFFFCCLFFFFVFFVFFFVCVCVRFGTSRKMINRYIKKNRI